MQPSTEELSGTLEGYQILKLNNERFTVPELLLRPSNIHMEQKGIAETIVASILQCPKERQFALAENIVLAGGNANFPGLRERIEKDVQALSPNTWRVKVFKPERYALKFLCSIVLILFIPVLSNLLGVVVKHWLQILICIQCLLQNVIMRNMDQIILLKNLTILI